MFVWFCRGNVWFPEHLYENQEYLYDIWWDFWWAIRATCLLKEAVPPRGLQSLPEGSSPSPRTAVPAESLLQSQQKCHKHVLSSPSRISVAVEQQSQQKCHKHVLSSPRRISVAVEQQSLPEGSSRGDSLLQSPRYNKALAFYIFLSVY